MKPIIEITELGKRYHLQTTNKYFALRDVISDSLKNIFQRRRQKDEFWALQHVNLALKPGDRLGIIGKNGAGKSTLLKILSRITPPTTGRAVLRGRFASLLEVGTGFHPELTGRENIYLNGSILGLRKDEIQKQFDVIVDFSGVEKFIDMPLKHYSSGMELRLAFSVAAHLEPEILLIDEVLAVGDMEFQKKCLGKMEAVSKGEGRTILFVSHNLAQLKQICESAILLHDGKIMANGRVDDTINAYNTLIHEARAFEWTNDKPTGDYIFTNVIMKNGKGVLKGAVNALDDLYLEISIQANAKISNSLLAVRFTNQENVPVYTTTNGDSPAGYPVIEKGKHIFRIAVPVHLFVPGRYTIIVAWIIPNRELLCKVEDKLQFEVYNDQYAGNILHDGRAGVLNQNIQWQKID